MKIRENRWSRRQRNGVVKSYLKKTIRPPDWLPPHWLSGHAAAGPSPLAERLRRRLAAAGQLLVTAI